MTNQLSILSISSACWYNVFASVSICVWVCMCNSLFVCLYMYTCVYWLFVCVCVYACFIGQWNIICVCSSWVLIANTEYTIHVLYLENDFCENIMKAWQLLIHCMAKLNFAGFLKIIDQQLVRLNLLYMC